MLLFSASSLVLKYYKFNHWRPQIDQNSQPQILQSQNDRSDINLKKIPPIKTLKALDWNSLSTVTGSYINAAIKFWCLVIKSIQKQRSSSPWEKDESPIEREDEKQKNKNVNLRLTKITKIIIQNHPTTLHVLLLLFRSFLQNSHVWRVTEDVGVSPELTLDFFNFPRLSKRRPPGREIVYK